MKSQNFLGTIIDVVNRKIFKGTIIIEHGKISKILNHLSVDKAGVQDDVPNLYILPGFIDAHIHIESSMLVPSEFAKIAVRHGTIATVSDPHEIGNVLGEEGIDYMIENGKTVPFKFFFGCPSCVPATEFESAGAILNSAKVKKILAKKDIYYLSEMMNYPGVLHNHPDVLAKIKASLDLGKPVDGHAPGLMGEDAEKYFSAGISTDHECFTLKEALFKLKLGVKILIREGSAAKNYEALHPILKKYSKDCMFCSDDKHPHELLRGHINDLVVRSLKNGYDFFDILTVASVNPVKHYNLDVGLLQEGDKADFIVVDNLSTMHVKETVINGVSIYKERSVRIKTKKASVINQFSTSLKIPSDFKYIPASSKLSVIVAQDGQLITQRDVITVKPGEILHSDVKRDMLKIVVVNRYKDEKPSIGFIKNFGLRKGAIASCVAHDSHNIVAVGVRDEDISIAVNLVIKNKGGISAVSGKRKLALPLPVAGIMSNEKGEKVGEEYEKLDEFAKSLGSKLSAPFMTLSFMALPVIPKLKITDRGLFDVEKFEFV